MARAVELGELAVEVSDSLDPAVYGAVTAADHRALARAFLGNARRISSDLFGAEGAFQESLLLLKEGNRTSPVSADVQSLLGSLRIDQTRYQEAKQILGDALDTYRSFGYKIEEAKVLVKIADAEGFSGNAETAVEFLQIALHLLTGQEESRLHLQAHHNLAFWMVEAGDAIHALVRYEQATSLYDRPAPSRRSISAVAGSRGESTLASGISIRRETPSKKSRRQPSASSPTRWRWSAWSWRSSTSAAGEGERPGLAEEMTPIFRSQELHRHALAAVYLFRHEARKQPVTVGLLRGRSSTCGGPGTTPTYA